jgi:hypothetical protein
MEFFNQKEQVIDIQLTQYGKRRLAAGRFKPAFYAFYDKDVLYNSEFGGYSEVQNDSETRIKSETPRLTAQHNFIGADTQLKEMTMIESKGNELDDLVKKELLQDVENKFFADNTQIGTTKLDNRYNPSWDIKFYNDHLINATLQSTGSGQVKRIPQLEAELVYKAYATNDIDKLNIDLGEKYFTAVEDFFESEMEFDDGSILFVKDDFILLGIEEKNTNFYNENFEIEIFLEELDANNKVKLTPLKFSIDEEDLSLTVDQYLEIEFDEEISDAILCEYVKEEDKKSLYVKQIFTCPDEATDFQEMDIYSNDDLGDACE